MQRDAKNCEVNKSIAAAIVAFGLAAAGSSNARNVSQYYTVQRVPFASR